MYLKTVIDIARKFQDQSGKTYWKEVGPDSEYFHPKSNLDSLAITELIVAIIANIGQGLTIEKLFQNGIPKTLGELAEKIGTLTNYKQVGVIGRTTKLVILDCDETLWEGVALLGPVKVRSRVAAFISKWTQSGCLFALCSKNDKETVDVILKEQPVVSTNIVARKINWNEKGQNVIEILNELNLLPENTVFLDNDPFERGRVKEAVRGIWCPDIAIDGSDIDNALSLVDATIPKAVTEEDRNRAELYRQEAQRKQSLRVASGYEEWLKGLDMEVAVRPMMEADLERARQLVEKAHQWKLTNNDDLLRRDGNCPLVAEYKDKYGSAGIIGVAMVSLENLNCVISQFVMSCRVIGRGVEDKIYEEICDWVGKRLHIDYVTTEHNQKAVEWARKVNSLL